MTLVTGRDNLSGMTAISPLRRQSAEALQTIMKCREIGSDQELADLVAHLKRVPVQQRRKAATPMNVDDLDALGAALDVPPELFLKTKAEIYAWFGKAENVVSMQGRRSSTWQTASLDATAVAA